MIVYCGHNEFQSRFFCAIPTTYYVDGLAVDARSRACAR